MNKFSNDNPITQLESLTMGLAFLLISVVMIGFLMAGFLLIWFLDSKDFKK